MRVRRFFRSPVLLGAILLCVLASAGQAAIIYHPPGSLLGPDVEYTFVSESSTTDAVPLYGAPSISGNSLIFNNLSFAATSISQVPPADFTDGQVNVTIEANPGKFLQTIFWQEFGDYNVSATGANPAAINFVQVFSQALQLTVLEINNVPVAPIVDNVSAFVTVGPSGGSFQTVVDPSTGSWSGSALADLIAIFGTGQITKISVSYNNQLFALSDFGGIASISKKGVIITPTVPEPAMLGFLAVGVMLLGRRR